MPALTACIPTMEAGQRAMLTTVSFVSVHNSDRLLYHRTHSPVDRSSRAIPGGSLPQQCFSITTLYRSSETDLWAFTSTSREETPPLRGLWNHKEEAPLRTSRAGFSHHTSDSPLSRDSKHWLRRQAAGFHVKNSPHSKNIKPMQGTQGCSHMIIAPKATVETCFS